jgi:alkaline phosphatase D
MGGRQENWFYNQLTNASTRGSQWKIVGQQIVCESRETVSTIETMLMTVAHLESVDDVDAWDGYEANRRRVLDTITENNIDNVIVISGDSQ